MGTVPAMTTLEFNEEVLDEVTTASLRSALRSNGYCVLPDVWSHRSAAAFDSVMRSKLVRGAEFDVFGNPVPDGDARRTEGLWLPTDAPELIEATRAPRVREFLPFCLTPTDRPAKVQMFEAAWVIDEKTEAGAWHKDYPHYEGMGPGSYQCPEAIYLSIYYRDMRKCDGPTQIICGSHLDRPEQNPVRSPGGGIMADQPSGPHDAPGGRPVESFTIRSTQVVVWDQRCWHRRGPGGGGQAYPRINSIFGFNSIQTEGSNRDAPYPMHPAMARAWLEASDPADQLLYGGKWSPSSIAVEMQKLRRELGDAKEEAARLQVEAGAAKRKGARL